MKNLLLKSIKNSANCANFAANKFFIVRDTYKNYTQKFDDLFMLQIHCYVDIIILDRNFSKLRSFISLILQL